jgi:hypothetical protein
VTNRSRAGIGFRVKTGYAGAITLIGGPDAPAFFGREDVLLADLDVDDSRQPYHAALERGERIGAAVVKKARHDAQRRATTALEGLLQAAQRAGWDPRTVGLVVGSNVDPATLGNLHIRAHALEGRFYREVLDQAATSLGLKVVTLLERDGFIAAAEMLGHSAARLKVILAAIGKAAGRPWRRDEQLATLAAWVALAQPRGTP